MRNDKDTQYHTADAEWIAAYSAGALSEAKRLVIDCQAAIEPRLAQSVSQFDHIGGAFIETAKGEALSDDFSERLSAAIEHSELRREKPVEKLQTGAKTSEEWAPSPLLEYLERSDIKLKWRKSGHGVARAVLAEENGERLYLLRARSGMKLPEHAHSGQEWTLVLQGGYKAGGETFVRGDLHCEDESCQHQPVIDDHGEDCISLVVDEGPLVFKDRLLRLIQPILGI